MTFWNVPRSSDTAGLPTLLPPPPPETPRARHRHEDTQSALLGPRPCVCRSLSGVAGLPVPPSPPCRLRGLSEATGLAQTAGLGDGA